MLRTLGTACLLLLVVAAGFIWWWGGGGTTPPAGTAPPTTETQPKSKAAEAGTVDATMDLSAPERSVVESLRTATLPIADDAVWFDVTVVDATTKEPVAGAEVWWSNEQQRNHVMAMPPEVAQSIREDRERLQREFGWHALTDSAGHVRITPGKSGASVIADAGERFGSAYFYVGQEPPKGGRRLEVAFDRTLRILTLDANDQPAPGVPVQLIQHDAQSGKPVDRRNPTRRESGDDGIVTIRHAQWLQTWSDGPLAGEPVPNWALLPVMPGIEAEPVMVDAQSPPTEPVELRLPVTGHLSVRITFEGRAIPSLKQVGLHTNLERSSNALNRARYQVRDANGWHRFAYVPLGKTYIVGNHRWDVEIAGPVAAGQETQATIEIADKVFALSGRVLGDDGQPLTKTVFPVKFDVGRSRGGKQLTTDEEGRFLWLITKAKEGESLPLKELSLTMREADKPPKVCTVAPRDLKVGRNDLGDLRFALEALVVSGRLVFGSEGRQLSQMHVERFEPNSRPGRPDQWREVKKLTIAHQENGNFDVRGKINAGRYRLVFGSEQTLPVKPVEFVPGAENVTIHIACGSGIKATCLLPKGINAYQMRAELVPHVAPIPVTPVEELSRIQRMRMKRSNPLVARMQHRTSANTQFTWRALPDGTYTLRFETQGSPKTLKQIPNVVIPPPPNGDPRLVDIDLRDTLRSLKITVRRDGPVQPGRDRAMVFVLPQPDDSDWRGLAISEETSLLPVPAGPVDLMVFMDDRQPVTVRGVQDEVELTPKPWPSVKLTFPGLQNLPKDVRIMASCASGTRPNRDNRRYQVGGRSGQLSSILEPRRSPGYIEDGAATIQVGEGVQNLRVRVRVGRRTKSLKQFGTQQLVAGTPATVQLSMDEILAAAEELRAAQKK